jgi:hypothetical protein
LEDSVTVSVDRTRAAIARSILACPDEVELLVDGVPHPLADDERLALQDWAGTPTFACAPQGTLSRAGLDGRHALLTLTSPVAAGHQLVLAGQLRQAGSDRCDCCDDERAWVVVDLVLVALVEGEQRRQLDVGDFADPALELNAGFLARTTEHLNDCHGEHLRHAVAQRTGVAVRAIAGVRLADLTPRSVELRWVSLEGAHRTVLRFAGAARSTEELGMLLRRSLHPGLC